MPIQIAAHGITQLQPAVIDINPADIPFVNAKCSDRICLFGFIILLLIKYVVNAQLDGHNIVLIIQRAAVYPLIPTTLKVDPPLKNNHVNHMIFVPNPTIMKSCPTIS